MAAVPPIGSKARIPPSIYRDLHQVSREVAANTGACLMVRRDRFDQVGGFDESFAVSGNDVDFCLRLSDAGFTNLWTPHSRLIHHESVSRKRIPVVDDEFRLWRRWHRRLMSGDPYYSRAFSEETPDCTLAVDLTHDAVKRAARIIAMSQDASAGPLPKVA